MINHGKVYSMHVRDEIRVFLIRTASESFYTKYLFTQGVLAALVVTNLHP